MAFELGGVRLVSTRALPDAEHARMLWLMWERLPDEMTGGNGKGRGLYSHVTSVSKLIGVAVYEGWRMLANLERLGAFEKQWRSRWIKRAWPADAPMESFRALDKPRGRAAAKVCPHCGRPFGRGTPGT